ncbi:MAG: 50S ribosomal protein L11 methyltransferase, partial [Chloroflexi bacterium]|nr:50S ribosomal protein L11 methyltransferase [Chloroflexota bacterium]
MKTTRQRNPARPPALSPAAGWLEVAVEVAGIDSDLAADVLRQACPGGVAIEPAHRLDPAGDTYVVDGDAPALVKGYLPTGPDSARLRRSLRLALGFAPLQQPPRWRRARRLREEDWRHSWKRYFRPQRIGSLVVKPSWTRYSLRGGAQTGGRLPETVIEIDPGMAFGTGQHPTTAMCLRALQALVRRGDRVLDLGAGSGILAIAAAKLGAGSVLALDVDPLAVRAARQN